MRKILSGRKGLTLLEMIVAMVLAVVISLIAYTFYQNFMAHMERQKQVNSLQNGIRQAVDCINRYLIAGGVAGDSLFFDPHHVLVAPVVNGGHRVFDLQSDSSAFSIYGNYSGSAATLADPVVNKTSRWLKTDKAGIFKTGGFGYIYAGSAQEVVKIQSISDSTIWVQDDFFAAYPKGTLIFPLERISISRTDKQTLNVSRESANGASLFARTFVPSNHPGDSLDFKVMSVDRQAGQIVYALTFMATTGGRTHTLLSRKSEQTVFVRGF